MNIDGIRKFASEQLARVPALYLYHSGRHTLTVVKYAREFGELEGLSAVELDMLETAAWFHDLGYVECNAGHEAASARLAERVLPKFGFTAKQTELASGIIRTTKLPVLPATAMEKILCDADVEYIGRSEFYRSGMLLRQELSLLGRDFSELEWLDFEIKFLTGFRFFSAAARRLRSAGQLRRLRELELARKPFTDRKDRIS
ncbi:MAG: HD domain-containing protein [Victivallaceae bacterium]|nr:HD domain-containing protein [Victivallaceae bacterium]